MDQVLATPLYTSTKYQHTAIDQYIDIMQNMNVTDVTSALVAARIKRSRGARKTHRERDMAVVVKSHVCIVEGCGKAFTRAEHSKRHALNRELYMQL